ILGILGAFKEKPLPWGMPKLAPVAIALLVAVAACKKQPPAGEAKKSKVVKPGKAKKPGEATAAAKGSNKPGAPDVAGNAGQPDRGHFSLTWQCEDSAPRKRVR